MTAPDKPSDPQRRRPRLRLRHWPEFVWLWLTHPTFRHTPNKRRVFLEQLATKKSQQRYS